MRNAIQRLGRVFVLAISSTLAGSTAVQGQAVDKGIVRTMWVTLDEFRLSTERQRSPLLLRCVEDYLAGNRYPLALVYTDPSVDQADEPLSLP